MRGAGEWGVGTNRRSAATRGLGGSVRATSQFDHQQGAGIAHMHRLGAPLGPIGAGRPRIDEFLRAHEGPVNAAERAVEARSSSRDRESMPSRLPERRPGPACGHRRATSGAELRAATVPGRVEGNPDAVRAAVRAPRPPCAGDGRRSSGVLAPSSCAQARTIASGSRSALVPSARSRQRVRRSLP